MRALRLTGLAPPATIGVGMVLDPRDGTAWSVRSALAGFAFGITGLVAVLVMAASLTDNRRLAGALRHLLGQRRARLRR